MNFYTQQCRKILAKSLIFSYIRVKKIMFNNENWTGKVDLHIFSLVSLIQKDRKSAFIVNFSVENTYVVSYSMEIGVKL